MLTWSYKECIGTLTQHDDVKIHLYIGNALLIGLSQYIDGAGEEASQMATFVVDKDHAKNLLKAKFFDEYYKSIELYDDGKNTKGIKKIVDIMMNTKLDITVRKIPFVSPWCIN